MPSLTKKWIIIALMFAAVIISVVLGEYAGWPFLAEPLEKKLSTLMSRKVSFDLSDTAELSKPNTNSSQLIAKQSIKTQSFHVSFLGGFNLKTAKLHIAAPSWSAKPHFINGDNIQLKIALY